MVNSRDVVASRVECIGEVVTDETGILVGSRDSKSLEEGIKEIYSKDYVKMGKNSYKMAKEKYTWEQLTERTINAYKNILGGIKNGL